MIMDMKKETVRQPSAAFLAALKAVREMRDTALKPASDTAICASVMDKIKFLNDNTDA